MTREETIRQYCQLRRALANTIEKYNDTCPAHDCFCEEIPHTIHQFQDEVFAWIREAVADRVGKDLGLLGSFRRELSDIIAYDIRRERDKK